MSSREHWLPNVRSSVKPGDVITGCRDNYTRTYRLFVNKGWMDVQVGRAQAYQFDSCCDLSIEDLRALSAMLQKVIAEHQPWPERQDD